MTPIENRKDQIVATITFPHHGTLIVDCGGMKASLKELIVLKQIYIGTTQSQVTLNCSGEIGRPKRMLARLRKRNYGDIREDIHAANLYSKARELGLMDEVTLRGLAAINWNYTNAVSTREFFPKVMKIAIEQNRK